MECPAALRKINGDNLNYNIPASVPDFDNMYLLTYRVYEKLTDN